MLPCVPTNREHRMWDEGVDHEGVGGCPEAASPVRGEADDAKVEQERLLPQGGFRRDRGHQDHQGTCSDSLQSSTRMVSHIHFYTRHTAVLRFFFVLPRSEFISFVRAALH